MAEAKCSTVTVLGSVGSNVMVQGFERKDTTGKGDKTCKDKMGARARDMKLSFVAERKIFRAESGR